MVRRDVLDENVYQWQREVALGRRSALLGVRPDARRQDGHGQVAHRDVVLRVQVIALDVLQ
jgi:hypothetical protein